MPLEIRLGEGSPMMNNMWKNETGQRIFLDDKKENIVPEDTGAYLLVGIDGSLPMEDAVKYGLMEEPDNMKKEREARTASDDDKTRSDAKPPEEVDDATRKAHAPASDKAVSGPADKK